MYYIETLDAHEMHGPFDMHRVALRYARHKHFGAFRILTAEQSKGLHDAGSYRAVRW